MLDSVFSIIGLELNNVNIPDTALLTVGALFLVFVMDWIFHLLSTVISTITRR